MCARRIASPVVAQCLEVNRKASWGHPSSRRDAGVCNCHRLLVCADDSIRSSGPWAATNSRSNTRRLALDPDICCERAPLSCATEHHLTSNAVFDYHCLRSHAKRAAGSPVDTFEVSSIPDHCSPQFTYQELHRLAPREAWAGEVAHFLAGDGLGRRGRYPRY